MRGAEGAIASNSRTSVEVLVLEVLVGGLATCQELQSLSPTCERA